MNVLLGFTGSIASSLSTKLIQSLGSLGEVRVISTAKAGHFTLPPGVDVRAYTDADEWGSYQRGDAILHIELRNWADVLVIAPLSANTLAKLSHGLADNLLTCVARAWDFSKPIVVAPAMNTLMWDHPVTASGVATLQSWGYAVVAPMSKTLACGETGVGALAQIDSIVAAVRLTLDNPGAPVSVSTP